MRPTTLAQAIGITILLSTAAHADDTDRAEAAAQRAEAAAVRSEDAAKRVEAAAERLERLVDRMTNPRPARAAAPGHAEPPR